MGPINEGAQVQAVNQARRGVRGTSWGEDMAVAGIALLVMAVLGIAWKWGELGAAFYGKVVPFFDSLSYQDGFAATAARSEAVGAWRALAETWAASGNNVVLYRFFAAALGGMLPADETGLYVYLGCVHAIGAVTLGLVAWRMSGAVWAGVLSVAAWFSAQPFQLAREGVLDQRMDLASASFYVALATMAHAWARRPSQAKALGVGVVLALAALHRPVMAVSALVVVLLFAARSWRRRRGAGRGWWREAIWMAAPGLVLTLPWMLAHVGELYRYYAVANVDVGSAATMAEAGAYNAAYFMRAFGGTYAVLLGIGVVAVGWRRGIDRGDVVVVVLATLAPLVLLTLSRSMGNHFVCQLSLGVPALLLACGGGREEKTWERGWGTAIAVLVLACVLVGSIRSLAARVEGETSQLRNEAEETIRQITAVRSAATVATFHNYPVNVFALRRVAGELGQELNMGTLAYHPHHFGIPNERAATLGEDELRAALMRMVERVCRRDDLLMLPAAEADVRLPNQPYSHRVIPALRKLVEADGRFRHVRRVGPMEGIEFDLFAIER